MQTLTPRRRRIGAKAIVACCLSLLLAGCTWSWKADAEKTTPRPVAEQVWQITPAAMRVYPSTRLVHEANQTVLEARIEFVDDVGDPLKAVGDLRLELFRISRPGEPPPTKPLYTWNASILTQAENQTLYDPVTRSYLLRLNLDAGAPTSPAGLRLHVLYMPPGSAAATAPGRLEAETVLAGP